jgi:hypothetical protein
MNTAIARKSKPQQIFSVLSVHSVVNTRTHRKRNP